MRVIVSVVSAIFFYIIALNIFELGPIAASIPTILVYFAVYILIRSMTKKSITMSMEQISDEYYQEILKEGVKINGRIKALIPKITHEKTKEQALKTMDEAERILKILETEPQEVKIVRQFFSYYLLTFEKVLAKSIEINSQANPDEILTNLNARVYDNLTSLEQLFQQKINDLMEDDVMDLDNELLLLEKMMQSEGVKKI